MSFFAITMFVESVSMQLSINLIHNAYSMWSRVGGLGTEVYIDYVIYANFMSN